MQYTSEVTDEDLIRLYIAGEELALKALIERYTAIIYNFVMRFVGATNAPDIVQEVFIKVWKNIKRFDDEKAHFKTWIFTIARNTVTDYLRKKKLILFTDIDNPDESFAENITDNAILPDEALQKLEDKELLNDLLAKLPTNYQEVLLLYYQEDMTFDEIGKVLDKPLNTVKSYHHRALLQLRKMVL